MRSMCALATSAAKWSRHSLPPRTAVDLGIYRLLDFSTPNAGFFHTDGELK